MHTSSSKWHVTTCPNELTAFEDMHLSGIVGLTPPPAATVVVREEVDLGAVLQLEVRRRLAAAMAGRRDDRFGRRAMGAP